MSKFPSEEWLQSLLEKLNSDEDYARIASKWEGDMLFTIEPSGPLTEEITYYLDLWHGKCRGAYQVTEPDSVNPALILRAPYNHVARLVQGELDPIQAILTRKMSVKGNMSLLLRNVPTVLDFIRCCKDVTDSYL